MFHWARTSSRLAEKTLEMTDRNEHTTAWTLFQSQYVTTPPLPLPPVLATPICPTFQPTYPSVEEFTCYTSRRRLAIQNVRGPAAPPWGAHQNQSQNKPLLTDPLGPAKINYCLPFILFSNLYTTHLETDLWQVSYKTLHYAAWKTVVSRHSPPNCDGRGQCCVPL